MMCKNLIDLYLGSNIGIWVLEEVWRDKKNIGNIITLDKEIAKIANNFGSEVIDSKNINNITFETSYFGFSVHYPKLIKKHLITKYKKLYNLHPSYLPWGKGYYPVFWALWEGSPAGATLHEIDQNIDTGNIVEQIKVDYCDFDTGYSLFQRVRESEKILFKKYWSQLLKKEIPPSFTQVGEGSFHTKKEFFKLKRNCEYENIKGVDLIRLIRYLTFEGYTGLEIILNNQKFELSLRKIDSDYPKGIINK
jgi:methionyl-tRNA formyltransferase